MDYIVYKRFRGKGIGGEFNLRFGTICTERGGFLYAPNGRCICAVTSENGWEHFRPNTEEAAHRQKMLDRLYRYYLKFHSEAWQFKHPGEHIVNFYDDYDISGLPPSANTYWKNLLRTMPTPELEAFYKKKFGGVA